ncbi:MAG: hypothetical protein HY692_07310, partial [Cyanobacteria bacterium NC_groundwater_1444_Ag_S-0.65um_54_12]|nr:hypothetical protein [Cyanobacteria bacterium NC_groundwater_1444_Ag_S-0.65um_54_12]
MLLLLRWTFLPFLLAALVGCAQMVSGIALEKRLPWQNREVAALQVTDLDQAIDLLIEQRVSRNNALTLHIDGAAGFSRIKELIRLAQRSLWFETFVWHDDETGIAIAKLLQQRALEGVDVRVLLDAMGSNEHAGDRKVLRILEDHGIPVRIYNPPIAKGMNVHLTHRKLYLADSDHAITGGMNIGNEYANVWHDLVVEIKGAAARQMHVEFVHDWNAAQDGPPEPLLVRQLSPAQKYGDQAARVAVTSPYEGKRAEEIRRSISCAIDYAKQQICTFQLYLS